MNGYDRHSTVFARPGRTTITEASGDTRSDGKASQTKDGANRYDTSTPERRKKALAAARRSGNPADEERVKKQLNSEAGSTADMPSANQSARRDNRAKRRGGYRSPSLVDEATDKEEMDEAKGKLPPWLQKDGKDSPDDSGRKRRGKVAESALNPQIRPRDAVSWNGFEENVMVTRKRGPGPDEDEEDGGSDPL